MRAFTLPQEDVLAILQANGCRLDEVNVIAVRGWGDSGVNRRKVYDDLVVVYSPEGTWCFKHNADPNGVRKGVGTGAKKGMAMIAPGIHIYGTGLHRGKLGFRQCEVFTVIRDGDPPYRDTGWHATNWHSGGFNSTSSLGCQTNPPDVWAVVRKLVYDLLEKYKNPKRKNDRGELVRSFNFVLIEEKDRAAGNLVVSRRYLKN